MSIIEFRGLSDQINDILLNWIIDGRLNPGEKLNQGDLAKELGVSRTPIREALKSLEAQGFFKSIPNKGVYVQDVDPLRLVQTMDIRYILEMYAAEKGSEFVTDEDLRELSSLIERGKKIALNTHSIEYNVWWKLDWDIHRLIVRMSRNDLLSEIYEKLAVFLHIARVRGYREEETILCGQRDHKIILDAYVERDKESILHSLSSHLETSKANIIRAVQETREEQGE